MRDEDLSYFQDREFQRALLSYEDALQNGTNIYMDADELTDIAEYYMMNNQEEMADKAISLAVRLHPGNIEPQVFLARREMFHDNMNQAFEICNAISDQNNKEVILLRAELLIRNDQLEEAETFLMKTCKQLSENQIQFMYDSIGVFIDYKMWEQALMWCTQLREQHPHYKGVDELEAEIHYYREDYKKSINLLNKVLDRTPYDVNAWNQLAQVFRCVQRYDEAVEASEYALAIDNQNPKTLYNMARSLYEQQNYEQAHHYLLLTEQRQTLGKDLALHLDALCLAYLGKIQEAISTLQNAITLTKDPEQKELYEVMVSILKNEKLKNRDYVLSELQQASRLVTTNRDTLPFYDLQYGEMMMAYQHQASYKKHFERALYESENPTQTLMLMGVSLFKHDKYDEAYNIFNIIKYTTPNSEYNDLVTIYIAACYQRLGEDENYLFYLREISESDSKFANKVLGDLFPESLPVKDYYKYAFQQIYGHLPPEE